MQYAVMFIFIFYLEINKNKKKKKNRKGFIEKPKQFLIGPFTVYG